MSWSQIFGTDAGTNRAERRKADQEWKRMMRRNRRAQDRERNRARSNPKKED